VESKYFLAKKKKWYYMIKLLHSISKILEILNEAGFNKPKTKLIDDIPVQVIKYLNQNRSTVLSIRINTIIIKEQWYAAYQYKLNRYGSLRMRNRYPLLVKVVNKNIYADIIGSNFRPYLNSGMPCWLIRMVSC
jgi:hypothetical protein